MDYWDHLGWKDPFGSKAHAARQKAYRPRLEIRNLVTPEILIDNAKAKKGWEELIRSEAAKPAYVTIAAEMTAANRRLTATIRLTEPEKDLPAKAVVRAVLFQKKAVTEVSAGENKGKTLTEYFLIRKLHDALPARKALSEKGVVATFDLPKGVRKADLGLAVLVEDPDDMETLEAASFDLPVKRSEPRTIVIRETTADRGRRVRGAIAPAARGAAIPLLVAIREKLPKTDRRPVLLAFSAAGEPALKMAAKNRKNIVGLVLIAAPVTIDAKTAKALGKDFPVLLLYGKKDAVAPAATGEKAARALRDAGVNVTSEILEVDDHFGVLNEGAKRAVSWVRTLR